jgi:ribonuclease HI
VQWFHAQLSLELLVGSAAEARGRWLVERPRVELMQRTAEELGAHNPESGWPEMAAAIAGLENALDTATNIRTSSDATTITEAANVVNRRRQELQMRIDAVHRTGRL